MDTMSGKEHMIAGKSDAHCTRECMKSREIGPIVWRLICFHPFRIFIRFTGKHTYSAGVFAGDQSSYSATLSDVRCEKRYQPSPRSSVVTATHALCWLIKRV